MWQVFSLWVMRAGLPLVGVYHMVCAHPFCNVSIEEAKGMEKVANICFIPFQYLFVGKMAKEDGLGGYVLQDRFSYEDSWLLSKTIAAYCVLPSSLVVGVVCKAMSFFSLSAREHYHKVQESVGRGGCAFQDPKEQYASMGIPFVAFSQAEKISCLGYERREKDKENLRLEKEALQAIVTLFHEKGILYWLDCGTCLGAYRYGGSIPWDWDIDIAILQKDFSNVRNVLSTLDPEKYLVQDWSNRDLPGAYLKVYVKQAGALIDIYHFAVDEERQEIHSILAHEKSVFLPESWKIRERRYTIATPFSYVFPLKKMDFDGIEAFVPCQVEKYLQQRYGENISPVKLYNAQTGLYEKDETHPYWQLQFANER